jgi:hypothetical protein
MWFDQLWNDAYALQKRYRLPLRSGWWEDHVQVESLAALASWVEHYDSGEWDDPPGRLALLYDLERVAQVLRDGTEPFHPDRDPTPVRRRDSCPDLSGLWGLGRGSPSTRSR